MRTKVLIMRFVAELPKGRVFITRELLTFGLRATVDSVTSTMVAKGYILRLANGVFVRNDVGLKLPTLKEIVEAKARAHVKRAINPGAQLCVEAGLKPRPRRNVKNQKAALKRAEEHIVASYAVLGDTSRFTTIYGRVEFRRTPSRKYNLAREKFTQVLAAWWSAEKMKDLRRLVNSHMFKLGKIEKKRFKEVGAWAPARISDLLLDDPPRFATRTPRSIYPLLGGGYDEEPDPTPVVSESFERYLSSAISDNLRETFQEPFARRILRRYQRRCAYEIFQLHCSYC